MSDGQSETCQANGPFPQSGCWFTWDIETGPLSDAELRQKCPEFKRPEPPGKFDESSVKTGNLKDASKIEAKIDAARKAHETAVREYEANCETAEKQHFEKFKSEAALHADTGQTILIATYDLHEEESYLFEGNEIRILTNWWELVSAALRCGSKLAGVNTHDFDLPFLIRRSWLLGVRVPHGVVDLTTKWMNFAPNFVDLRQVWQIGNKSCPSSFDRIGKAFGTGGKCEGDHGAEFAALYATDPDKARAYAINDVIQPAMWLSRFGLVKKVIDLNHEKECVSNDNVNSFADI